MRSKNFFILGGLIDNTWEQLSPTINNAPIIKLMKERLTFDPSASLSTPGNFYEKNMG